MAPTSQIKLTPKLESNESALNDSFFMRKEQNVSMITESKYPIFKEKESSETWWKSQVIPLDRVEKLHYGSVEKKESNDPTEKSKKTP